MSAGGVAGLGIRRHHLPQLFALLRMPFSLEQRMRLMALDVDGLELAAVSSLAGLPLRDVVLVYGVVCVLDLQECVRMHLHHVLRPVGATACIFVLFVVLRFGLLNGAGKDWR